MWLIIGAKFARLHLELQAITRNSRAKRKKLYANLMQIQYQEQIPRYLRKRGKSYKIAVYAPSLLVVDQQIVLVVLNGNSETFSIFQALIFLGFELLFWTVRRVNVKRNGRAVCA